MNVWAFNKPDTQERVKHLYESVQKGKSRFGWSWKAIHDLNSEWTEQHNKQNFLLYIKKGDWIVHINMPEWGWCVAAKVSKEYRFDSGEGIDGDFRHFFEIDVDTIVKFKRKNPVVDHRVNLKPRQRYHRVYAVEEFKKSIERIKNDVQIQISGNGELHHLYEETDKLLTKVTSLIQQMHRGKKLEGFLAKVFAEIPDVVEVRENGSGWGTDYGADLIVTIKVSVAGLDFEHKIVVQVKSYEGEVKDTTAVDQIKRGFEKFGANAGMIITTGERTEELETAAANVASDTGLPIHLLAGKEVAQFVIKTAPDLVFRL